MAQQPIDFQSPRDKRELARRARRLAQTQNDADRIKLMQFAAELDQAADALERRGAAISLPPTAAPPRQAQQPSADAEPAPPSI